MRLTKKQKILIKLIVTLILLVWLVLQDIYAKLRVFQTWPNCGRVLGFFGLILLFLKLIETTSFADKHPIIAFIIPFAITISVSDLSKYFSNIYICNKDCHYRIGFIFERNKGYIGSKGMAHEPTILVLANNELQEGRETKKEFFDKINIGDTIILKVSRYGDINIETFSPTHEEIEFYKVPQHYIDGELQAKPPVEQYPAAVRDSVLQQSHKQLGFVFEKIDDEYYRHFLRVGIADSLTTLHEFYETDRLYAKAYKRIGVGDTVIVRTADAMPQINQVVNWRPTQSEIQKCRIPAPYTATATQNYTQAFVDSVMQQSHEQLGFVFDKYEDEHVGAYLEVGVSDTLTRTYRFYKYQKLYTKIFKTISIGDTVTLCRMTIRK